MHYHYRAGIAHLTIYTLHNALWMYLFKVNSLISSFESHVGVYRKEVHYEQRKFSIIVSKNTSKLVSSIQK